MTDPDVVFAKLVDANPVPSIADVDEAVPAVAAILSGAPATTGRLQDVTPARPRWAWVAAAAVVLVVAVGGLFLARRDQPATQIATEPPSPEEALGQDAVSTTEVWLAALNAGDIDRVMALSDPATRTEADRRVHEWQAGLAAAGMPIEVRACGVASVVGSVARVECAVRLGDLVAVELGVADLVAPFGYNDGLIAWRPYTGGNISDVNDAYSSYLQLFHTAEYEARCSPAAYPPGGVVQDRGLALTGECAQVAAPLAADIAQWISDGRPEEQQ